MIEARVIEEVRRLVDVVALIGERVDLTWVVQHWRQSVFDHLAESTMVMPADDQDGDVNSSVPELDPFFDEGDTDTGRTRAFERARHGLGAVAVTIGFEHGPHRHIAYGAPHQVEVVAQVTQVHLGPGRAECIGRQGSGWAEHAGLRGCEHRGSWR